MDGESDNGLSGWAWYQMGRMAADGDRQRCETVRALLSPPPADTNALVANNRALVAQNQALWAQSAELQRINAELVDRHNALLRDYQELSSWADGAAARLKELGVIRKSE